MFTPIFHKKNFVQQPLLLKVDWKSFSVSQKKINREFQWFNKAKQCYEQLMIHFQVFPLFGIDKSKNSLLRFRIRVHVVESSCTRKVPFPDALKKFWAYVCIRHIDTLQPPWQSTGMCVRHSHVIFYELLIVDKWIACTLLCLLLDLCEWERSRQFGLFDLNILNFNCFFNFALSMQCIFWTVLLSIHLQITCGRCGFKLSQLPITFFGNHLVHVPPH